MKVVIIKECKDGKINDILEVSDGYGKNFLIKKGYALPLNKQTSSMHDKIEKETNEARDVRVANANQAKAIIEAAHLVFKLKTDGAHVHGAVSKKAILKELAKSKIKLSSHALSNIHLNKLGLSEIKVSLGESIFAILKVEVQSE